MSHNIQAKYILPFFLLIISQFSLSAQSDNFKNYKPLESNSKLKSATLNTLTERYKALFQNLPSEYKDKYKELYTDMQTEKMKSVENEGYLFNDYFQTFFDNILNEIKRGNPNLPLTDIKFLISRSYIPNASASLEAIIVFNLGLLSNCDNESQVAFIICHEIAHHQLKHSQKFIKKYFDALYSKNGQNELKKIIQGKYDTYEKAEKYIKSLMFDRSKHSRDSEQQADSLALIYLSNTRFDATQSSVQLLKLDVVDSLMYIPTFDLTKVFDTPQYRFKKSWLDEEETMFGKGKRVFDDKWNEDSLKTHPSCQKRAQIIKNALSNYINKDKSANLQSVESFSVAVINSEFETIIAAFDFDKVDYALFQTLNLLKKYPENVFLQAMVGHCFNALFDGQKDHHFSKLVSMPSKDLPKDYQPFIRFLNNLTLREIALVNYHYVTRQNKAFLQDEFFLYNTLLAAKNAELKEEAKTYKSLYLTNFPKGKYKDLVLKL